MTARHDGGWRDHIHVRDPGGPVVTDRPVCFGCGEPMCGALSPDLNYCCTLTAGHAGDHENEWKGVKWAR